MCFGDINYVHLVHPRGLGIPLTLLVFSENSPLKTCKFLHFRLEAVWHCRIFAIPIRGEKDAPNGSPMKTTAGLHWNPKPGVYGTPKGTPKNRSNVIRTQIKGMKTFIRCILFIASMAFSLGVQGQYADHRNRKVDSLEQVLKTQKLEEEDLYRVYDGLMNGYLQTDAEKSSHYAKLAIELAEKHKLYNALTDSWRVLGLQAYGACLYDSAQHCFDHALQATELMKHEKQYNEKDIDDNLSALYGTLGNLYNIQGKLHLALDYYQKALPIFQKHGWKESECILFYNVGELYLELANYKAAEDNYQKALNVGHQTGDSLMVSGPYSGLAMTALNAGEYQKALEYAQKSIVYYQNHADEELESLLDSYVLFSRIYHLGFKDLDTAQQYMSKALVLAAKTDSPTNASDAYAQQASLCLERKEWNLAVEWARKALDTNDQDPQHNIGLYKTLSQAYSALGNTAEAQHYINLLHDTMEEQSTTKYQSALSEMEVRYQTLEKEAQLRDLEQRHRMSQLQNWLYIILIVILVIAVAVIMQVGKQRRRISNMQARMEGEAEERTRLGRDLHDRLGGLLTSIHMQSEDENIQELSKQATEEMRRVAHHLMPASLKEKGLATALRDFCRVNPIVSFSHHGQDLRLQEQQEVMLYCATHELVNNALKHAQASHIMVQLMMDEEFAAVIVADDGKGFDPETVEKNMGLRNIRERVELQQGRMNISSSPSGTEINIEIPL